MLICKNGYRGSTSIYALSEHAPRFLLISSNFLLTSLFCENTDGREISTNWTEIEYYSILRVCDGVKKVRTSHDYIQLKTATAFVHEQ